MILGQKAEDRFSAFLFRFFDEKISEYCRRDFAKVCHMLDTFAMLVQYVRFFFRRLENQLAAGPLL